MCECVLVTLSGGVVFFFFKQKTAYEMRISDWSSDVCSSDLMVAIAFVPHAGVRVGHVLHGFFVRTLGEPARLRQSRAQGVLEQTRDRHRADPAGNRRNG